MNNLKTTNDQEMQADATSPSVKLNGQYIKQLSFDNPQAPASFMPAEEVPRIEVSVNFVTKEVQENIHEVTLSITANAKINENELYAIKLEYSGLFTLINIDDEQKEKILSIHCPMLLFPYARRVVSETTKDAGFQPLILEHMDFGSVYHQTKTRKE